MTGDRSFGVGHHLGARGGSDLAVDPFGEGLVEDSLELATLSRGDPSDLFQQFGSRL